ncbi:MAG: hypothetical protein ABIJ09_16385 [Pseudomonadota bacterium]
MRRWIVAVAAVALFALAGLGTVTSAPSPSAWPAQDSVRAHDRGVELAQALLRAPPGPFRAGAAQVQLELPAGTLLGGYASLWPRRSANGGQIAVTALSLSTPLARIGITGLDAVTIAPALYARIHQQLDGWTALITSASHSHSGPGGCSHGLLEMLFMGPRDEALLDTLARAHLDALAQARAAEAPAQLLDGQRNVRELVVNRTWAEQPIDGTLDVLALVGRERLIGRLVTFNAHATLIGARDRLDPDYPGALRQSLAELDGSPVLFAAGATGSASAPRLDPAHPAEVMGRTLASVVDNLPLRAGDAELALAWQRLWWTMPAPLVPLPRHLALRPWLSRLLVPQRLPVDVVRVGRVILMALPGELSAELSLASRQACEALGWHLVFTSHNGMYAGYFMPARGYQGPGPEAALELHGPGAGDILASLADGLCEGLGATQGSLVREAGP